MKIEKVYPAGWKMETNDEIYYFGEYGQFGCYCNDGVVYKNEEAFRTGKGVCYIPEFGFENKDENVSVLFEFEAKESIASELEGNSYVAIQGYTRADLEDLCEGTNFDAEDFFEHLDWMSPETLMNEWIDDEEESLC
jgi:hypothetical protein